MRRSFYNQIKSMLDSMAKIVKNEMMMTLVLVKEEEERLKKEEI